MGKRTTHAHGQCRVSIDRVPIEVRAQFQRWARSRGLTMRAALLAYMEQMAKQAPGASS